MTIDGGTTTGWGLFKPGLVKPRAGLVQMPDVERDIGWWGEAFLDWMVPFARLENVTDIVYEAPIIAIHKDERTQKRSVNYHEIEKLVAMSAFAALGARQLGVRFHRVSRTTVCKHFIGVTPGVELPNGEKVKRKYIKNAFIVKCQSKGWNVTSEDMADTLGTLDWFVHDRGIKVPWNCQPAAGPLFEQRGVRINPENKAAAQRILRNALSFDRERTSAS